MEISIPPYGNLEELATAVRKVVVSPMMFKVLNTRLLIQTGLDLKAIAPEQNLDLDLQLRVAKTLARMGIQLEREPS